MRFLYECNTRGDRRQRRHPPCGSARAAEKRKTQPIDAVCFRDNPNTFVHVFLLRRVLYILYALACVPDYPQAKAPRRLAIEAYIGPLFTT